ncbi:hypothetical protein ACFL6T_05125 [Candidatus Zixiibacteriota bacterium]
MSNTLLDRYLRVVPGALLVISIAVSVVQAQNDYSGNLHATLRGWEDGVRVTLFDRSGSYFGRLSEKGILQRFNRQEDEEYALDIVSFGFSSPEDYEWYTRRRGARWRGGSIDYVNLVQAAEIAGSVPISDTWNFDVLFNQASTLQARRSLVRAIFRKSSDDGNVTGFLTTWLKPSKEEMDLEFGLTFTPGQSSITVAAGTLDPFSDIIYQVLGVSPKYSPVSLDFIKHPLTARLAADIPLGGQFRSELYGLIMSPGELVVTEQVDTLGSFRQDERYGYAGALLEWAPSRNCAAGVFATVVKSGMERQMLDQSPAEESFDLNETTGRIGVYGMQRLWGNVLLDAHLARVVRLEDRSYPEVGESSHLDYKDRTLVGRGTVTYRALNGFRGEAGIDFDLRDVIRDADIAGRHHSYFHSRFRFDLGWYVGDRAMFVWGANVDLDRDTATGWFDGGHARFQVFW